MSTLDEVRKAYEDLSEDDKRSFHQSIADRVHESIAAQEEDRGETDSQSAEDREHEALGAEHADGEGDVEELHETDPEDGKENRDRDEVGDRLARLEALVEKLVESKGQEHTAAEAADAVTEAVEDRAKEIYGIGGGAFVDTAGSDTPAGTIAEQARALLRKIK